MKQEYNKKVIIIDNKLYDLQEIKSVSAYNKLKETSEKAFYEELKRIGVNVTIRKEFGSDIDAACGQLRAKKEGVISE